LACAGDHVLDITSVCRLLTVAPEASSRGVSTTRSRSKLHSAEIEKPCARPQETVLPPARSAADGGVAPASCGRENSGRVILFVSFFLPSASLSLDMFYRVFRPHRRSAAWGLFRFLPFSRLPSSPPRKIVVDTTAPSSIPVNRHRSHEPLRTWPRGRGGIFSLFEDDAEQKDHSLLRRGLPRSRFGILHRYQRESMDFQDGTLRGARPFSEFSEDDLNAADDGSVSDPVQRFRAQVVPAVHRQHE